jgi:hypothetical protein
VSFADLFDRYSLNARLRPTLLALFPAFVTAASPFPATYNTASATVTSLAVSCGVLLLLASGTRYLGRKKERRLFESWGGKPTTAWLRHRDIHLDPLTKARYHTFLSAHVAGLTLPTPDEERAKPELADNCYESAVKWLLEHTRDSKRFPLVLTENINYGFARNLLAIRPVALAIAVLCLATTLLNVSLCQQAAALTDSGNVVALGVSLVAFMLWIALVSERWVKDAAFAYARALLASCDVLK